MGIVMMSQFFRMTPTTAAIAHWITITRTPVYHIRSGFGCGATKRLSSLDLRLLRSRSRPAGAGCPLGTSGLVFLQKI